MNEAWGYLKRLAHRVARDDVGAYAAALSYNFSFALLPLLLFATALLAFLRFRDPVHVLTAPLAGVVPKNVLALVAQALQGVVRHKNPTVLSLGFLGFVWGMSGAFRQIIDAMNHAYEFRFPFRRRSWELYGLSVLLGMTVGSLLVAGLAFSVLGPNAISGLATTAVGRPPARLALAVLHWGLLAAMLWLALSIVYAAAPDRPHGFRLYTPGTMVALVAWAVLSIAFRQYTTRVNTFGVYGTLGAMILLLLYLYLFGFLLLVGAEVNALAEAPANPEGREGGRPPSPGPLTR